ncbi:MAG TPA: TetR family transcriptional regulator [Myxococcales bacterium]|nr:TetR family transcriptional regulator [Deltaproteobacteria bacterium]MBU51832.1 TetR family transcriptional regulator [Deltaproteobacteria bacterium]HAA54620.1 TetR family transcriptional regulator [Myxococcales bacterium]|tara:strand:- start:1851 stop:2471 length:621 start_codon:yes stop_codon:yes gene_type:complete
MASKAQKKAAKTKKRELILDAAIEVLAERGFAHTKIRNIAEAAGVADGTIYLYFKNKDELLIHLFEDVMSRVLAMFQEALGDRTRADEKLKVFLQTQIQMIEKEPSIAKIISVVLRQSSTFVQDYKNPLFSRYLHLIEEILVEGIEQKLFRSDLNPEVLSRAVFGAVDELTLAWLLSSRREDTSLEQSVQVITKLLLSGLAPQAES